MVEGNTGLNVKDYPFAFSITALFFPSVLNDTSNFAILGILLVGGMLGSLLTILNPVNRIMTYYSKHHHEDNIFSMIFGPRAINPNQLIQQLVSKNFKSALTSPQITFENNKTVAMLYFIIILASTIIQSFVNENFMSIFSDQYQIWAIRGIAGIGIIAVVLVMLNHIYGTNFKFNRVIVAGHKTRLRISQITGPFQLSRICCVTVANLAIDFANISNEGLRWNQSKITDHDGRSDEIIRTFYKLDKKVEKILGKEFTCSRADFEVVFNKEFMDNLCKEGYKWHDFDIKDLYHKYSMIKDMSHTYAVKFSEALSWFNNRIFFDINELYEMESKLRSAIESRDWELAELSKFRIMDNMRFVLENKQMPEAINDKWKLEQDY